MGTRFMATRECSIHSNIKRALVEGKQSDTRLILRSLKNTERVYKNAHAAKAAAEEEKTPGDIKVVIKYISGSLYRKSFHETGNTQDSVWSCGQVMGLIDDVPTCQELVGRMIAEASSVISGRLGGMMVQK